MPRNLLTLTLFLLCLVSSINAQDLTIKNISPEPVVTFTRSGQRVRFTAPSSVVQIHLQVYDEAGQLLFDVNSKGNVFDWMMQSGGGEQLNNGNYLCVVTVKTLSGKLTQRIGVASVRDNQIELHQADAATFNAAQQQAVGPIEENAALTILSPADAEATTVMAHDGKDGQIVRSRGVLSFRLGDFYSGKDIEQMRLTEEGNLGIGTDNPRSKLEVVGDIRASGTVRADRVEFADGTVQTSGQNGRKREDGTVAPNATGTGTQNQVAKWIDNAGTLGDSVLTNIGTNVGLGVASPEDLLDIAGAPNAAGRSGIHVRTTSATGNATLYFDNDRGNFAAYGGVLTGGSTNSFTFFGLTRADKTFLIADGPSSLGLGIGTLVSRPVIFGTANTERMRIETSGNVGIGTTTPGARLDVLGTINTSTQYNIGAARVLSVPGTTNTFVGVNAGNPNTMGSSNIVIGKDAGLNLGNGSNNIYLGNAGANESNHIRIGTEGTQTATFIAGINGVNVNPATSVVVGPNGQLGVVLSSRRYKQDIRNMGGASIQLMRLRPVTFHYRPEYAAGDRTLQYGLIAEEVANVYPDLVSSGADGKPETVRYHLLSAMLLNEVQKQQRRIQSQAQLLRRQRRQIVELENRLRRLEKQGSR